MARTVSLKGPTLKLAPENDIWRDYNPEKATAALRRLAGAWSDIDADDLATDIKRWRKEGSRK